MAALGAAGAGIAGRIAGVARAGTTGERRGARRAHRASDLRVPRSFATFVADREPRTRVRSCTACYLDLGDSTVAAPGGRLVHFLSDQQWVLHWLLYVGSDGSEAVVATDLPYGFDTSDAPAAFDPVAASATVVCAESFGEFLYHFWIENEIWFALADPDAAPRPLTEEQRRYAEHYARRGP